MTRAVFLTVSIFMSIASEMYLLFKFQVNELKLFFKLLIYFYFIGLFIFISLHGCQSEGIRCPGIGVTQF